MFRMNPFEYRNEGKGLIPMQLSAVGDQENDGPLRVRIVAGGDGSSEVYADAGTDVAYRDGAHTTRSLAWTDSTQTLRVGVVQPSRYRGQPDQQSYQFRISPLERPTTVTLRTEEEAEAEKLGEPWPYDEDIQTVNVQVPPRPTDVPFSISLGR